MKKVIQLFFFIILVNQVANAQYNSNQDFKKFGVLLGGNFSNMNFNQGVPKPTTTVNTSWLPGITFGFLMRVPITDNFWIQPQYQFTQMGSKLESSGTTYKLNYFTLPVLLKYMVLPKFTLAAGPHFDLLIRGYAEVNGTRTNITHNLPEPNSAITAGAGYQVLENLNLDIRYMHGFNHVGFGEQSNSSEFKFEMVQLSISTNF
jgi:hypothetical protein